MPSETVTARVINNKACYCGKCSRVFDEAVERKRKDGDGSSYDWVCPHCGAEFYNNCYEGRTCAYCGEFTEEEDRKVCEHCGHEINTGDVPVAEKEVEKSYE